MSGADAEWERWRTASDAAIGELVEASDPHAAVVVMPRIMLARLQVTIHALADGAIALERHTEQQSRVLTEVLEMNRQLLEAVARSARKSDAAQA